MQSNDTQPLTEDQAPLTSEEDQLQKAKQNWQNLLTMFRPTPQEHVHAPQEHVHGPFTFLLNQNHNALRGCQSCGQTWVGVMAGLEDDIRWHSVQEPPEEEE